MTIKIAVILVKKLTYFGEFDYLKISCLRKSIILMFLSSLRDKFMLLYQNSVTDVSGRHVGVHPDGHQHGVFQISINLAKKFFRISCLEKLL